jgi:tetratricopeptide (TPR) repeat protein
MSEQPSQSNDDKKLSTASETFAVPSVRFKIREEVSDGAPQAESAARHKSGSALSVTEVGAIEADTADNSAGPVAQSPITSTSGASTSITSTPIASTSITSTPIASASVSSARLSANVPVNTVLPVAPRLAGLPHPLLLLVGTALIIFFAGAIEIYRAQVSLAISDQSGPAAPNFVDMQINYANVLARSGRHLEAAEALKLALARCRAATPAQKATQAQLMARLAQAQFEGGQSSDCAQTIRELLALLDEKTLPAVPITVVWQLDGLARSIGYSQRGVNPTDAERRLAISVWRKAAQYWRGGNTVIMANYYSGMAHMQLELNEFASAGDSFMKVIALSEMRKDKDWRLQHLNQAAFSFNLAKDFARAADAAARAIPMAQRLGPRFESQRAYGQYMLGQAQTGLGNYSSAIANLEAALPVLQAQSSSETYAYCLNQLANAYRLSGDKVRANQTFTESIKFARANRVGPSLRKIRNDWNGQK